MGQRGPKPAYERHKEGQRGAPLLAVRLEPPIYSYIKAQKEGTRAYLERLVTEDIAKAQFLSPESTTEGELGEDGALTESTDPSDLPGQLLLPRPVANGKPATATKQAQKTKE